MVRSKATSIRRKCLDAQKIDCLVSYIEEHFKIQDVLQKESRYKPDSIWGKCCQKINVKNSLSNRTWVYFLWTKNRHNIRSRVLQTWSWLGECSSNTWIDSNQEVIVNGVKGQPTTSTPKEREDLSTTMKWSYPDMSFPRGLPGATLVDEPFIHLNDGDVQHDVCNIITEKDDILQRSFDDSDNESAIFMGLQQKKLLNSPASNASVKLPGSPAPNASVTPSGSPASNASVTPPGSPASNVSLTPPVSLALNVSITPPLSPAPNASVTPPGSPASNMSVTPPGSPASNMSVAPPGSPASDVSVILPGSPDFVMSVTPIGSPASNVSGRYMPVKAQDPTCSPEGLLASERLFMSQDSNYSIGSNTQLRSPALDASLNSHALKQPDTAQFSPTSDFQTDPPSRSPLCVSLEATNGFTAETSNKLSSEHISRDQSAAYDDNETNIKTSFTIDSKSWQSFTVIDRRSYRTMGGDWRNKIKESLMSILPTCVPSFTMNRVKRLSSRKRKAKYWRFKAKCSFRNCGIRYRCYLKKNPSLGKDATVKVHIHGQMKHEIGELKATKCEGKMRQELGKEASRIGPTELFHQKLGEITEEELTAGNMSSCKSPQVLKKAAYDYTKTQRLHDDMLKDIILLQEHINMEDSNSNTVKGYIQFIGYNPFSVHLYSEEQLKAHSEKDMLYFDATGTVCKKIDNQEKRVLYYALVSKGGKGEPALPVAEMLTNDHSTTNITNFLLRLCTDFKCVKNVSLSPVKVEVDFSWALIHACLLSFCKCDVITYLKLAWNFVNKKTNFRIKSVIHLCSAHIMHLFMKKVRSFVKDNEKARFLGRCLGAMIVSKNIDEVDAIFRNLCVVLNSKKESPVVSRALSVLNNDYDDNGIDIDCHDASVMTNEDERDCSIEFTTLYSQSPFYQHYKDIFDSLSDLESDENVDQCIPDNNDYYCPHLAKIFLKLYMPYLPLWSGLLLTDLDHDTNAYVENWMGAFQKHILGGKKRMRPADIIKTLRVSMKGRTRRRILGKRKNEDNSIFEEAEETWNKNDRIKKKKTYLQKANESQKNKPGNSQHEKGASNIVTGEDTSTSVRTAPNASKVNTNKGNVSNGIPWGGRYANILFDNTCTMDVGLQIMASMTKENPWIEEEVDQTGSMPLLVQCLHLIKQGKIHEAKYTWLQQTNIYKVADKLKNNTVVWNAYGSENQNFIKWVISRQRNQSTSICSENRCYRKKRTIISNEILLSMPSLLPPDGKLLQSCFDSWASPCNTPCMHPKTLPQHYKGSKEYVLKEVQIEDGTTEIQKITYCAGVRCVSQKSFIHGGPPFLIASLEHAEVPLTRNHLCDDIRILGQRYRVFATTHMRGGHDVANISILGEWHLYDGLQRISLKRIKRLNLNGLQHIYLVRDSGK